MRAWSDGTIDPRSRDACLTRSDWRIPSGRAYFCPALLMPHADEHHRAPLLWLLGPYLAGLVIAAAGAGLAEPLALGMAVLLGGAAMAMSFARGRRATWTWGGLLALAAALGGLGRMQAALDPGGTDARWRGLPEREAILDIALTRLFAVPADSTRQLCLGEVTDAAEPLRSLAGRRVCFAVDTTATPAGALIRSTHLRVRGVLRRLDRAAAARDGFETFLANAGVGFMLERTEVQAVVQRPGRTEMFLHDLGRRFETILRRGLPPDNPATAVYVAMFLGLKSELSDAQKENYLRSGTMHLFAISGLHIAMIAFCLEGLLIMVRVRPAVAAAIGLLALWIFVETTGGTPSARRAFLMVAFVWAGSALRRPANPLASLVASALLVLLWDPLALLSASFQLSYAVVAAVLLYGLPLRHRWQARVEPVARFARTGMDGMALAAVSLGTERPDRSGDILFGHARIGAAEPRLLPSRLAGGGVVEPRPDAGRRRRDRGGVCVACLRPGRRDGIEHRLQSCRCADSRRRGRRRTRFGCAAGHVL